MGHADRQPVTCCPRCGYDQRGVVESWRESCPLRGTCTECGLDFAWTELLRPELHEPRWCVEYAPRLALRPPPVRRTILRSLWPWWFWRSLKMSHELRPGRLVVFVLMLMTLVLACYVIEQTALAVAIRIRFDREMQQYTTIYIPRLQSQLRQLERMAEQYRARPDPLPDIDQRIAFLQTQINASPPVINHSYADAVIEAVLTPWAATSRATITGGAMNAWGGVAYPPPSFLHLQFFDAPSWSWLLREHRKFARSVISVAAATGLLVLLPSAFVLLPISRRRARVRWSHIARVTVYSLIIPTLLICVPLLAVAAKSFGAGTQTPTLNLPIWILTYVPLPLIFFWWSAAIRNYLRMPHAWLLAGLLMVLNLLVLMATLWLCSKPAATAVFDLLVGWR